MAKRRLNGEGTIYWHKGLKRYMIQVVDAGIRRTFYATTQAGAKKKLRGLQRKQDQGERLVGVGEIGDALGDRDMLVGVGVTTFVGV